jgi:hypothetical protein
MFWNAENKNIDTALVAAINNLNIDMFVLAEFDIESTSFLETINNEIQLFELVPIIGCERISIYLRTGMFEIEHGAETTYYTSKKIKVGNFFEFLMVAVHLPSKLNQDETTQTLEAAEFKREIEQVEVDFELNDTIVLGDFNMNPFEKGMVSASAFHSVPCEKIALGDERIIKQRKHQYFYNPMWNLFGDLNEKPGTYFHRDSEQAVYFWNILDQIIMRPSMTRYFIKNSLSIITEIGDLNLTKPNGRPDLSDHLPIYFEFNFTPENENAELVA